MAVSVDRGQGPGVGRTLGEPRNIQVQRIGMRGHLSRDRPAYTEQLILPAHGPIGGNRGL